MNIGPTLRHIVSVIVKGKVYLITGYFVGLLYNLIKWITGRGHKHWDDSLYRHLSAWTGWQPNYKEEEEEEEEINPNILPQFIP
jgi:hypothetical protein